STPNDRDSLGTLSHPKLASRLPEREESLKEEPHESTERSIEVQPNNSSCSCRWRRNSRLAHCRDAREQWRRSAALRRQTPTTRDRGAIHRLGAATGRGGARRSRCWTCCVFKSA